MEPSSEHVCVWHKVGLILGVVDQHRIAREQPGKRSLARRDGSSWCRSTRAFGRRRTAQQPRFKLKQSGQDAVSGLRGGGEVVRGGVKRVWQRESSTRWSGAERIRLAYLAVEWRRGVRGTRWRQTGRRQTGVGLPGHKSCSPRSACTTHVFSGWSCESVAGRWSQNFDLKTCHDLNVFPPAAKTSDK